jgi:cytochrome c-type biogenesis protein CcmH/NrfF
MRILLSFILFFLLFHNLAYAQVAGTPPVFACSASQWIDELKGSNNPICTQPAFTDLSGSLADTQCPDASASVEGCVTIGTQTFAGEKTIQDPFHFLSYYELGEIAEPTTPGADIARVYVADENGKTRLFLKTPDGSVIQINQDSYIVGTNRSGATANPGEVFYIDGSTGQVADFKKAKADSATTMPAVAMALDTILDTNTGRFMTFGVGRDLDTNAFTEADKLYVSAATAGALTTTIPTHPNFEQRVGVVIRKHPNLGSIAVFFGATRGAEDGTNKAAFTIGTSGATSVVLQSNSTGTQKTANFPDATGEVSLLGQLISFITPAEIADECAGLEALRRNAGDSAWECFTPGGGLSDDSVDYSHIFYTNTLGGNPAMLSDECFFMSTATGGCFICEGSTANTNEQAYCFPDVDGVDTTQGIVIDTATQTLTNKTLTAADNAIEADDLICTDCIGDTEVTTNAGTSLAADLEEEAHCSEHDGRSTTCNSEVLDADAELYTDVKCINIDPAATTTNWLFWRTELAITVTGIDCIVDAATSVIMTLQECDANGGTCGNTEAAITCAVTNTTESGGIDDAAIDAGDWIRVTRGTVTGSPTQVNLCMTFTYND